jgi:Ca2+-dependent lipid-binding protein
MLTQKVYNRGFEQAASLDRSIQVVTAVVETAEMAQQRVCKISHQTVTGLRRQKMKTCSIQTGGKSKSDSESIAVVGVKTREQVEKVKNNGILRQLIEPAIDTRVIDGDHQDPTIRITTC